MKNFENTMVDITPQVLLKAYRCGIFPMAENADDTTLYWIEPEKRGIIPLKSAHIPRSLAKVIRQKRFEIRIDSDFAGVIKGCGSTKAGRKSTWINQQITDLYTELFKMGHCHTVEAWVDDELVGGLYGVELGGAFFGESMFSYERDASKVALIYLIARLKYGGFQLLDTQFITDHLRTFGAIEVSREKFQRLLENSVSLKTHFLGLPLDCPPELVLQSVSQTSKTGCSTP